MDTLEDWMNPSLLHRNRLPARAYFGRWAGLEAALQGNESERLGAMTLNGSWRFLYVEGPELSPPGFESPGFDDGGWDTIDVPSHWQLKGYGAPHYTDVYYQFPIDPPFVPRANPTGLYRRRFVAGASKRRRILRFHGVDSAFHLWVNGEAAGFSKVSRMTAEFDVSDFLAEGENDIALRVYQWSDGSYLEDQDMWWLSGIFRDVELYEAPETQIFDIATLADYRVADGGGSLSVSCDLRNYSTPAVEARLELDLFDASGASVADARGGVFHLGPELDSIAPPFQLSLPAILPWSAESPSLYRLVVSLYSGGTLQECASLDIGFRTISLSSENFLVNGKAIRLKGVNRHDFHPESGRYVDRETMLADVLLMKRHNINAVRCSHYPNHPYFLELCDRYGLYVIDEADLETHGFEWIEESARLADDPGWTAAYVDRIERLVLRDRNRPSVLFWSLGNESGMGNNFRAMAARARALDASRLIHYEEDRETELTDVYSTMYTRMPKLLEIAHAKGKPHILCEYAHAMGNGPGGLADFQEILESHPRLQGAFVWEWIDHGLARYGSDGRRWLEYGGQYGDAPHNGNFCIDGLVFPDRAPSPGLIEYKKVIEPISTALPSGSDDRVTLLIHNKYDFSDLSTLSARWSAHCEGRLLVTGTSPLPPIGAGQSGEFTLPLSRVGLREQASDLSSPGAASPIYIDVDYALAEPLPWAEAGHIVGTAQFELGPADTRAATASPRSMKRHSAIRVDEAGSLSVVSIGSSRWTFDRLRGRLGAWEEEGRALVVSGPELNFWRAPIDNDMYVVKDWKEKYFLQHFQEHSRAFSLLSVDGSIVAESSSIASPTTQGWGFSCVTRYVLSEEGALRFSLHAEPYGLDHFAPSMLPRLGVSMRVHAELTNARWSGLGPGEAYADSRTAQRYGHWSSSVADMHTRYVKPQENGNRFGVDRAALLDGRGRGLAVSSLTAIEFGAHDYECRALEAAAHDHEIERSPYIVVTLDAAQNGLGSNSCGQDQLPPYRLSPRPFAMALEFARVDSGSAFLANASARGYS